MGLVMMVGIFAVFYFLLILPQQRKQKKWQAMLSNVKAGDRVATSGGMRGVIMSVKSEGPDPTVILRVPPTIYVLKLHAVPSPRSLRTRLPRPRRRLQSP